MDVRPAEATGRDATFQIAFLNQAPAPAVVALAARDSDEALCVHIEPPDPVVVPPGATAVAAVRVRPTRRRTGDRPQRYAIEFRGRRVGWSEPLGTPDLVAHARFTYLPRPALLRRPGWLRRPPVSTLALMLTLLLVLLLQAYLATQPTAAPPAVPTPVLPTVAPRPSAAPVTGVRGGGPSIQNATATGTPIPTAAASPPALALIPDALSFGTQDVHTTSAARAIHIVNLGPTALTIASVSITGTTPRDFSASDACAGTTMSAYNGCTIRISFTPSQRGVCHANLVIADNAVDTPQIVPLSGYGGRPPM
jgi:hypothetical protein